MNCQTDDCECNSQAGRHFLTADEKIARLRVYHEWLTLEAKGVEERIAHIEKNAQPA
jgi:hypothetical protein